MKRKNLDKRNAAGGLGEGERVVRKGGWLRFGDDFFYSETLEKFVGWRVWINNLDDAFSPSTAQCLLEFSPEWITLHNVYHLACKNKLPKHLEFLRARLGKLTTL